MPSASIVPFMSGSTRSLNAEMKLKVSLGILWSFELSGYVKKLWCVLRLGSARTVNEYHSLYLTDRPERVEARVSATFQTDSLVQRYSSRVLSANNSSIFIFRGVSPCSQEYSVIVSSIAALALTP